MGRRPAIELMKSTVPRWRSIMPRSASWVSSSVAKTFTSKARRMRPTSTSASEPDSPMAALLINTSNFRSAMRSRSCAEVMSSLNTSNAAFFCWARRRNASAWASSKVVAIT